MFNFLLFLSLYLPFQLALNPAKGIDLASIRIFILLLFLFWLAGSFKNKNLSVKKNTQALSVISFLFLSFFSIFFAQNTDWSVRKLAYLFSIFPLYFVASDIINSQERILKVSKYLVFSGTLVAFLGIGQFFLQFIFGIDKTYKIWAHYVLSPFLGNSFLEMVLAYPSWLVNISGATIFRAISIFPDPHMFSFFSGLLIPIALGLFLQYRKKMWLISFSTLFLADILTFSRGGYLGLFFGALFLFIFFWDKFEKKFKTGTIFALTVLLLLVFLPNPISARFFSSLNFRDGSNMGRIEMWKKSLTVIEENPIFGVGIGNFPLEVKPLADYREPIYAHNTYLDITSESGILAGLAWIGMIASSMVAFWKKSKKNALYFCFLLSLIIFSAHSLVDTAIYSPVVLTLFLLIISFAYENENSKIA